MSTSPSGTAGTPVVRPADPRFSSGPCKKHPGWSANSLNQQHLGYSHRASGPKSSLASAIDRSAQLLGLPDDWQLGIVPASDTGAFEMAMWSLLGARGIDVLAWESFSSDWAKDIQNELKLNDVNYFKAAYGELPDLSQVSTERDVVFAFNGTTSGTRVPNLNWVSDSREGLVLCDATSAAFSMHMDFNKLDVVTWSWQKVLGGEAGFGMLALSPKAVERLETYTPPWPMPKIFRLTKNGKLNAGIFKGATINTPSMLAVADLHSALDWADNIGGVQALIARSEANKDALDTWIQKTDWIDWLPSDPATRSSTSMCLKITHEKFAELDDAAKRDAVKQMTTWLSEEAAAFDIGAYRDAPPGLRIWGGATVDADDITALTQWLDWAFARWLEQHS
jgi:phosphoserine aminotransferase